VEVEEEDAEEEPEEQPEEEAEKNKYLHPSTPSSAPMCEAEVSRWG
jgi:hypothetical protein